MSKSFLKCLLLFLIFNLGIANPNNLSHDNKITIKPTPLVSNIQLQGRIMPLDTIDISAPTNAEIDKVFVQLGQNIKKNQKIIELKSDQLEIDIRNAKENLIRTKIEFNKRYSWLNSDEVFQAKQSNIKNELNFKRTKEIYNQNKILYKQGIISQNELEQSEISYQDAELNLELSNRHLKQIINQGDETQLELLKLSLENAKAKLEILENIKQRLVISSPIDGVILKAVNQDKSTKTSGFLPIGKNINSGENILSIGNLNGFAVKVHANEQVIKNISLKQKVNIKIPALENNKTFIGAVVAIDAQPNNSDNSNTPPKYDLKIISENSDKEDNIFLGMTAKISFDLVEKEDTILIPFTSIAYNNQNQAYVTEFKTNRLKTITLGKTTKNKIEVIAGLKPGDLINRTAVT